MTDVMSLNTDLSRAVLDLCCICLCPFLAQSMTMSCYCFVGSHRVTNINFLPTISFYFFIFILTHNQEKGYEKENDQQREHALIF